MTTLTFQNTTLSVINQHNQTYITASDLGLALEYANPLKAISNLYNSNADEFTAEMTALIEMPTAGGIQKVRIFSLRGAHLIAMFARTKVQPTFIGIDIDRHFGSHYLHNLGKPLIQCMENIQAYIHASAERLMFVQGMASLLETPTAKKAVFK